jgi:hypothetical protein
MTAFGSWAPAKTFSWEHVPMTPRQRQLALQLGAHAGDALVVRVEEPSYVSRDAPLSGRADTSTAFRVRLER